MVRKNLKKDMINIIKKISQLDNYLNFDSTTSNKLLLQYINKRLL